MMGFAAAQAILQVAPWQTTTPSFRTATPRTSRWRRRSRAAVQRLGKPWYRRRALRIFRDDTSLSATPHLWPSIEEALARSRYLILLVSPRVGGLAMGRQGDRLLARAQEHRHAVCWRSPRASSPGTAPRTISPPRRRCRLS